MYRKGSTAQRGKSTTKEEGSQKEVRKTFKMLREVWLNIRMKKIDIHEDVIVKALLNSSITGMFMNKRIATKHGFRLQKLERPIAIRNVDRTNNSRGAITHQVEYNVYYKGYVKRMRINMCDLEKTEVILGMPWLAAYNLKINRKTWDHAIDLKETFKLQKRRIYLLSKNEREEVQKFMKDQLRKGYIRPSKSSQILPVFL